MYREKPIGSPGFSLKFQVLLKQVPSVLLSGLLVGGGLERIGCILSVLCRAAFLHLLSRRCSRALMKGRGQPLPRVGQAEAWVLALG